MYNSVYTYERQKVNQKLVRAHSIALEKEVGSEVPKSQ
jgi:hypothetical protein